MFDIPLLLDLFIPLIELKNIHEKRYIKEQSVNYFNLHLFLYIMFLMFLIDKK